MNHKVGDRDDGMGDGIQGERCPMIGCLDCGMAHFQLNHPGAGLGSDRLDGMGNGIQQGMAHLGKLGQFLKFLKVFVLMDRLAGKSP